MPNARSEFGNQMQLAAFPGIAFRHRADPQGKMVYVSEGVRELLGISPEEVISGRRRLADLVHPEDVATVAQHRIATATGNLKSQVEFRAVLDNGRIKWLWAQTHAVLKPDGTFDFIDGVIVDVTERKLDAVRERHHLAVLEGLVAHAPLASVLENIARTVEADDKSVVCVIMLLDKSRHHLLLGAAPSVPQATRLTMHKVAVDDAGSPCSIAAHTGKRVVVEDVRIHPLGSSETGKLLIHTAKRLSFWSEPIIGRNGRLLGTISAFQRQPHVPDSEEIAQMARANNFVKLALDMKSTLSSAHENERLSRATFDAMSTHLAVLDADGRIITVNQAWQDFTEKHHADGNRVVVGTDYIAYLKTAGEAGSPTATLAHAAIHDILADLREEWVQEFPLVVEGQERWYYTRIKRFPQGGPVRIVVAHIDITALKTAQQAADFSQRRFSSLFDFAPDAQILCDDAGCILQASLQTEAMFGWSPSELVGQSIDLLMPAAENDATDARDVTPAKSPLMTLGGFRPLGQRRDGSTFPVEIRLGSMNSETGHINIAAIRDVSERDKVLQELQQSSDQLKRANGTIENARHSLEQRVAARTAELSHASRKMQQAKAEAEDANRAKSAFLASMSHEIRTPMNGVIGMVEVLSRSQLSEQQADALATIRESAGTLLGIIDDILDFSKIEAGRLELHVMPVSLLELVESVCEALNPQASRCNVDLSVFVAPNIPNNVQTDQTRLRQILFNLVGNAIKFSAGREGLRGVVAVRAFVASTAPLRVAFQITDNGIGISAEALPRLFTPFTQAEVSTTRRFGGTGLGLAICKRLGELMQGEITVASTPGAGSVFTVTLPFEASPVQSARALPDLRNLHCIALDNPWLQSSDLRAYLESAGATFELAGTSGEAIQQAACQPAPAIFIEEWGSDHWATTGSGAPSPYPAGARRLLITRNRSFPAPHLAGAMVADGLLRRRSLLRAALATAGRASPEVRHSQQTLEEIREAPSIGQARSMDRLILVAEDDRINQKVILKQLAILGYAAEIAPNGAEALRLWRSGDYALLLTDLHMPEMDGYTLAQNIRREEAGKRHLPIIALTANAVVGEESRSRTSGMDEYLTKPVRLKLLETSLSKWLGQPVHEIDASIAGRPAAGNARSATLNVEVLRRLIGDDIGATREFLGDYLHSVREARDELRVACGAGNVEQVGAIAHRLKSSSRSVGALPLGDICAGLENASRTGGLTDLQASFAEFEAAATAVDSAVVAALGLP